MIEKNLEHAIITAIERLELPNLQILGLWQPSATGALKGKQEEDATATLVLKIPPKSFDTFGICEVTMDVDLALSVRVEKDVDGEMLLKYVEPISDLLDRWNMSEEHDELEDLITQDFYPGGVKVNGGTGPIYDSQSKTWTVTYTFTVRGVIQHEHN